MMGCHGAATFLQPPEPTRNAVRVCRAAAHDAETTRVPPVRRRGVRGAGERGGRVPGGGRPPPAASSHAPLAHAIAHARASRFPDRHRREALSWRGIATGRHEVMPGTPATPGHASPSDVCSTCAMARTMGRRLMPPAWGVEPLANAGPATDSCGMKRGRFMPRRTPRPQNVWAKTNGNVWHGQTRWIFGCTTPEGSVPNMATTLYTSVGNSADSPEPFFRSSPAMGHEAEIPDVLDPYLGYDAEDFPYQRPQRQMRSPSRATPFGGL
jgi:hypothetical protein